MMQRPWDRAQPDEWLPRNLRLCWGGSSGGDSSGGGWSGDTGGGWGGDSGFSATTGGGDWGSAGTYSAAGFDATGNISAWAGSPYDASTAGAGAGAGGDWGSFSATNYSGMNAPNPTFVDVAGPNPGVTTGGGDWGSAGAFSAEGTGGGPGGAMFGTSGGLTGGGGLFGDYGGGGGAYTGGGGLTGGGGGGGGGGRSGGGGGAGGRSGGGSFGSFGAGVGKGGKSDETGVAAPGGSSGTYGAGLGKGGASDETGADPDGGGKGDPDADPGSQFGGPETPAADPASSKSDAAPSFGSPSAGKSDAGPDTDAAPAGKGIGSDYVASPETQTAPTQTETSAPTSSAFGPQTLSAGPQSISLSDIAGAVYGPEGQQPSTDYAGPFSGPDVVGDRSGPQDSFDSRFGDWGQQPYAGPLAGPDVVGDRSAPGPYAGPFAGPDVIGGGRLGPDQGAPQWSSNLISDLMSRGPDPQNPLSGFQSWMFNPGISIPAPGWVTNSTKSVSDPWVDPNAGTRAESIISTRPLSDINTWLSPQNQNPITTSIFNAITGVLSPVDETSSMGPYAGPFAGPDVVGDRSGPQDSFDSRFGFDPNTDTTNWGAMFEGAAGPTQAYQAASQQLSDLTQTALTPQDTTPWGDVFEGAAPNYGEPAWGDVFEGTAPLDEIAPAIEAFIPGDRETNFEGERGNIEAFIPGGQPTDFGYQGSAAPAETAGQSAAAAAQQAGASPEAAGAAAAAAYGAAARGAGPAEQAEAAAAAAQQAGASQQQAMAIASGVYSQAQEGGGRPQSQGITLGQVLDAVYGTGGPYITPEGNVYGGHTVADIQAAVYGDNPPGMPTGNPNAPLTPDTSQQSYAPTPAESGSPGSPGGQPQQAPPPSVVAPQPGGTPTAPTQPPSLVDMQPTAPPFGSPATTTPPPPAGAPGIKGTYDAPPWQGPTTADRYLSDVYDRTPEKIDSTGNFTFKDPAAAQRLNMEKTQYAIGGLDKDVKTIVEAMGKAMDKAGVPWSISAAYRDNYRQGLITEGFKASPTGSWHGGTSKVPLEPSLRGGIKGEPREGEKNAATPAEIAKGGETYGLGRALDVTGAPRSNNQNVWAWIDQNGAKFGMDRPYGSKDPAHIQPTDNFRELAAKIRAGFDPVTGKYQTDDGKPDPNFARKQEAQDRAQREAARDPNAPRPPADIPPTALQPPDIPRPPADIPPPAARPPADAPLSEGRPPADIPAPIRGPNEFDIPTTPARAGRLDIGVVNNALQRATAGLNKNSGEAEFTAASVVAAKELARAGVPLAVARSEMQKGAYAGAAKNGFDINSWPMGGVYKGKIDAGIEAALQGYQPAKPGQVQGPPSPAQQRSDFGAFPQFASLSQRSADPRQEDLGREGDVGGASPYFGAITPTVPQLSPIIAPPAPSVPRGPAPAPEYTPEDAPGMFNPFRGNEAAAPGILHLVAGGRDVGAPPAVEPGQLPGRAEGEPSLPGQPLGSNLQDALSYPIDPRSGELSGKVFNPDRDAGGRVTDPDVFQQQQIEQQQYQQNLDPRGWQQASMQGSPSPAQQRGQLPGRAEGEAPLSGGLGQNLDAQDLLAPVDPRSETIFAPTRDRGIFDPDILQWQQQEREEQQQNLDPRGWQQALLGLLENFNPISTAEARSGRSQPGQLRAPQADPGTIQSRLSEQRSNVINDLQTNQGLRNTLDLIVTGEVGSQGKAAVLGFLETAMNKVAAEAAQQGRAATGRDLLQYLNNRSYFPDTWGKIESGRIKGGALTDDLLAAIAGGSNTTQLSTGNSSATSQGSRFGGNPTNATIGREHFGVENYGHHAAWYNAMGALPTGGGIGSDYAAGPGQAPAVAAQPPQEAPPAALRGLAKGGHVAEDEPVVVGEEGPEYFVPDQPGTVVPHMPQPGKPGNIDRWPKIPAPEYPGQFGGVEREIRRQTRVAQDPSPGLMDMVDSGQLRLAPNWQRMLNDPSLIALGRSRMDDRREGNDPGAEQYGVFPPEPEPAAEPPEPELAAEPPDPANPMAQALGYGSIRRPMRIGRQSYHDRR